MRVVKFFIAILPLFFICQLKAQKLVFVFGHAEYATVIGDLKSVNKNGPGVEAGIGLGMKKTFITGTVGTTWLRNANSNSVLNTKGTLRYTPFKIGLRRYIFAKNLFLKADAGIATMKYTDASGSSSKFTAGAGVGLKFTGFEVIGDYTNVSGFGSWLSVKAGFAIGL